MAKILLLIEDDPMMLKMYQKAFNLEGFEVELAANGQDGLTKAKQQDLSLILLDVMMPKMDGFEVLAKLKLEPATKNIPVIILTNLAGQQDADRAISMGAVKYLVKSEYDPKEIVSIIKEVLEGKKPGVSPNSS